MHNRLSLRLECTVFARELCRVQAQEQPDICSPAQDLGQLLWVVLLLLLLFLLLLLLFVAFVAVVAAVAAVTVAVAVVGSLLLLVGCWLLVVWLVDWLIGCLVDWLIG